MAERNGKEVKIIGTESTKRGKGREMKPRNEQGSKANQKTFPKFSVKQRWMPDFPDSFLLP